MINRKNAIITKASIASEKSKEAIKKYFSEKKEGKDPDPKNVFDIVEEDNDIVIASIELLEEVLGFLETLGYDTKNMSKSDLFTKLSEISQERGMDEEANILRVRGFWFARVEGDPFVKWQEANVRK